MHHIKKRHDEEDDELQKDALSTKIPFNFRVIG